MVAPLRVGLAGLGTVGSAVAGQIARARNELTGRAGRPIELVAYASKDPPKDASLDVSKVRKAADPLALARDPGIDVFVELLPDASPRQARQIATGAIATLVGSIVLSRAVGAGKLSDSILAAGRMTAGGRIQKPRLRATRTMRCDK